MTTVKKILRRARRIPRRKARPIRPANRFVIAAMHQSRWRKSVELTRDRNFKKAKQARQVQIDGINAEKERQADIKKARLKNLKKARRKLAKIRST